VYKFNGGGRLTEPSGDVNRLLGSAEFRAANPIST
jgi:hypothetical protein